MYNKVYGTGTYGTVYRGTYGMVRSYGLHIFVELALSDAQILRKREGTFVIQARRTQYKSYELVCPCRPAR